MILKSFLLGNLVSLCMKIINSVVVVGLYYGFLTTFSIGPSYLFLLRAQVMEEREEGTEKKVSAITGFITGQLMIFISIYYAPLHLALGRPHTITVLALPYLLFHFFWNNHKNFLVYGSTTRNSMRNLSIQCIFLNNIIFLFFNHFILPSSTLARLVNIFMFRCNNKMLFVTSSFFGWLIGHILFMKWIVLVLVWIGQNHSIRSNVLIRFNKYIMSKLINFMARIFSILLFITCVYHLGRIPSPILTKKLKKTSETKGIQKESQDVFTEEDPSPFSEKRGALDKIDETKEIRLNGKEKTKDELHFKATCYKKKPVYETSYLDENKENLKLEIRKNKEDKSVLWFEKPLVTLLFDYKRWNHPLRYIKNDRFENAVRNEMSQYFFYTCQSDGKLKISFTYLPSLLTFLEMIQRKISLNESALEILSSNELYTYWIYTNEYKRNKQTNEAINRIEALDKEYLFLDILEKRTRLCNSDKKKKEYLPKRYDPFLNGPSRETIKKRVSPFIINETFWINKIHGILLTNSREFEQKMSYPFDKKSLLKKRSHLLTLIGEFAKEPTPNFNLKGLILFPKERKRSSEDRDKFLKFLFHVVMTDPNNNHKKPIIKKSSGVKEISKKVSHWSYKLIDELEQQEGENAEDLLAEDHGIRSRKAKRVIIFTDKQTNTDTYTKQTNDLDQAEEVALIRYSQQSDFRRDIIKGSMRTQRRKTVIRELFQTNIHSPLFLERKDNKLSFLYFEIYELMKFIFRNAMKKNAKLKISDYKEEEIKEMEKNKEYKREEGTWIEIAETWDTILFAQVMRGCMLVTQSILRKYIILPSLIIAKNIGRMLLFQSPEWSADLNEWNREIHVKCTYNGVQLSETEFPKDWLTDGIQIKILFPFYLKPWYRSRDPMKTKRKKEDFCFLTVWGMEAELPFGPPRKKPSFFEPIFKRLEKKFRKLKKMSFTSQLFRIMSNERTHFLLKDTIKFKNWNGSSKKTYFKDLLFKDLLIKKRKNQIIYESSIQKKSKDSTKYLPTDDKMKDLADKTNKIKNKIDQIKKDKKKIFLTMGICTKKKNSRFIYESDLFIILKFFKYFMKKIYINIFIFLYTSIIKMTNMNAQLFLELTKKKIDKYIYNNEKKKERVDKTNKITIHFISTIKKLFNIHFNININNKNSQIHFDLSSFSQTYVFFKLSQIQIINLDKLRYVLQCTGTHFFLKNGITRSFRTQGIFNCDSKVKHNKLSNYEINEWKNWLKGYYQYDLSPIRWSRLVPQKWRNRVNQHSSIQNKELNKEYLYDKSQFIHYEKKPYYEYEEILLSNQHSNFKKNYRYELLSYKSINYENRMDASIYMSGSPLKGKLQVKNKRIFFLNYNTDKNKLVDMTGPINKFFKNYLRYDDISAMDKNLDKKYFDCRILFFLLKKKVDIEAWIDPKTNINNNKNIKTGTKNLNKFDKKRIFYLTIYQKKDPPNKKKNLFNWMGMNKEIRNSYIPNIELWVFQKLVLLYKSYKIKSWVIPIKSLLFNFNELDEKKKIEFENLNQKDLESPFSSQQKVLEDDYAKLNMTKQKKNTQNTQYKNHTETELNINIFLKRYLFFQFRWDNILKKKIINNIKVYCLLLRLLNPKEIALSSIRRDEMSLDIMPSNKKFTFTELMKRGVLILEPIRLPVTNNRKFLIYQIVSISCFYKSKRQVNPRNQEKRYVDKIKIKKSTTRHQRMIGNKDENFYDLLVLETILSPRRCREFRIRNCFNLKNIKNFDKNRIFCNRTNVKHCGILSENKCFDREKEKLIKLKFFLWPNFRLEDLTCINRYWFDTNNGIHFSMLRIHMYPQLKNR
uniref:Protein TIC 214 n=1 Tax=Nuytsia floribunda TaxID=350433 RepID=A0A8K1M8J5_NUYFL|nr:hypothetical chloroplast RF19 [Nuytsia floribunda]UBN08707.1 hypothetical chloroplast RF19 [Nuytsia floribunda]